MKWKRKIAVIATEYIKEFLQSMLGDLDVDYCIFTYKTFSDIQYIYEKVTEEFDGILTSGSFPAHMIHLYYKEEKRPICFFNTDEAALYRLFLKLLNENRNLDFTRVYADIVEIFGVGLKDFVEGRSPMPDIRELSADEFDMERMLGIEQEEYGKHVRLWEEGKIDLSVTRFSSIVPALQEAGVKVYFPFPSKRYVGEMCDKLLNEIERRKLEEQIPGVIIVKLSENGSGGEMFQGLDYDYMRLENLVIEFIGASMIDCSVHRRHYGLEIVSTKKHVSGWTGDFKEDRLSPFLREKKLSARFSIGCGLGNSLSQARLNALDACHEAELKQSLAYLINEREQIIGPMGDCGQLLLNVDNSEVLDVQSKLSPLTVKKIFTAISASEKQEITARTLALRLGITKRSANRFLAVLEQEGYLKIAYKTRTTTKGRPESVYIRTGGPGNPEEKQGQQQEYF